MKVIESFNVQNGDLVIVIDTETFANGKEFLQDIYDEHNNEIEISIDNDDILEHIAVEFGILIYQEGSPEIEELRGEKIE